jgi:BMFP domain-containing protein YqiC
MVNTALIDEVMRTIAKALPPGLDRMQQDVDRNLRAAVSSALSRLDLVTREEFEVQARVLERTRSKLERLEAEVAELEKEILEPAPTGDPGGT